MKIMLRIRTEINHYDQKRRTLHVQIPKKEQFLDNCLILEVIQQPKRWLFFDEGQIFRTIRADYVSGRINSLTYRHSINRYAIQHHNNFQVTNGKANLTDIVNSPQPLERGIQDYCQFIHHLHQIGIQFKRQY